MLPIGEEASGVVLGRVRLHGAPADPLRARQQLERALQAVDWSVPGVAPRSVLLLRHLGVPACSVGQPAAWPRRVAATLREQAVHARRPWSQADAVQADAVLFEDDIEVAACLVRDWLDGALAGRWWWRSVLAGADPAAWLHRHVLSRGELLVPVATKLTAPAATVVQAWFARLDASQAGDAAAAVARAFALHDTPPPHDDPLGSRARGRRASLPDDAVPASRDASEALAQWYRLVPELRASSLPPAQRRLLALVLALARDPARARAPSMARALSTLAPSDGSIDTPMAHASPARAVRKAYDASAAARRATSSGEAATAPARPPPATPRRHDADTTSPAPIAPVALQSATSRVGPDAVPMPSLAGDFEMPGSRPPASGAGEAAIETPSSSPRTSPVRHVARSARTAFGGIFYLLNAALSLGLYGDFTSPGAPSLALSPFDWLAQVGKHWFGAEFTRDPVWELLAALAGHRSTRTPGRDFSPARDWTLPAEWLAPFGAIESLAVHATRARLRVSHPAGFLVFDVDRDPRATPHAQAAALCRGVDALLGVPFTAAPAAGCALPRPGAARWLRCLLGYLEARLALALGPDSRPALPALVCRHAAHVSTSLDGVAIELSLADLPLAIRIAGLDRDPGWIPAAGRRLSFHFT